MKQKSTLIRLKQLAWRISLSLMLAFPVSLVSIQNSSLAGPFDISGLPIIGVAVAAVARNKVYKTAGAYINQRNAYTDRLKAKAQEQLRDRELISLRPSQLATYIKVVALIEKEREAASEFAEIEKKAAWSKFNDTANNALINIMLSTNAVTRVLGAMQNGLQSSTGFIDKALGTLAGNSGGVLGEIQQIRQTASWVSIAGELIGGKTGAQIRTAGNRIVSTIDRPKESIQAGLEQVREELGELSTMISDVQTRARQPGAGEAARDGLIAAVTGEEMDPSIEAIIDLLSRNKGPDFRTRARTALIGQSVARCSAIGDQYRKIIFRLESTPSDLAAVNDIEIPRCTVVDTEVMTAAEGVEQPTADQAVTESPAAGDSQPPPVQEITAEVVGTTEPPATPAIISPSQTSTKAPDEPVDPCVFMDPNALIVDKAGDYCNGEYSVEPYIGITISRIDDNVDMDSYCQAYYEDEYTQVLEEMNLGECGYISLFNDFEPNPDLSFHSGWEISFVFHQYRVTAYTRDQYASNRSALERMATSIEASIGDYYESD